MAGPIKHPLQCSKLTHFDSIQPLLLLKIIVGTGAESKNVPWVPHTLFRGNTGIHCDKDRTLLSSVFFFLKKTGHVEYVHLWVSKLQLLTPGVGRGILFQHWLQRNTESDKQDNPVPTLNSYFWKVKGRVGGKKTVSFLQAHIQGEFKTSLPRSQTWEGKILYLPWNY